jgi:hypothetical protein
VRRAAVVLNRRMRRLAVAAFLVAIAATATGAETPTAAALLAQMKAWLEPPRSSTRVLNMTIRSAPGDVTKWTAGQARAQVDGSNWILTVLLAPGDVRGTALLVQEQPGKPDNEWVYLPSLRRVRKVVPVDEFDSFLGTEFTYSDLGFVELDRRSATVRGPNSVDGREVYTLEEVPADQSTFKRIVTSLLKDGAQPLKREYYDPAGRLWKVETFEDVAPIHGVPTAQRVRMEDVQSGFGSEYRATRIAYDVQIPKELFDPKQLRTAADHPVWK